MIKNVDFNEFSLMALRKFAREIGVKCPTIQKKDELIVNIKRIINGEILPYKSNRGRKKLNTTIDFLNNEASVLEQLDDMENELAILKSYILTKIHVLENALKEAKQKCYRII